MSEVNRDGYRHIETAEELYQNAPCGYVSFLHDGTIFNINGTLLNWLGYSREEVQDRMRFQQFFKVGGQIYFETHFFPLIQMQGFVNEINFDILRKDKTLLPCLLNVSEVTSSNSEEKTYRASIFNISDRKNYERELIAARKKAEETSRAKAAFLSMISHEIRTPLNAILGIGNLFHKTSLNAQQKEYARILLNSSENLLGLVNNLLDMSKIESHKVKLEKLPFSVTDLLEVLISTFQVKCDEKHIELRVILPANLPEHLLGDPYKLNQVLTNLLGNAIKFTKEGYVKLEISILELSEKKIFLRFAVSDTGIGIAEDKFEAIFDEFSQASYDVGLKYGGTGLGLTISQRLLQLHGSKMQLESEEGKGSRFSFDLHYDLDLQAGQKKKKALRKWEEQQLDPAHILVVDDNPLNIFIINEFLSGWNLSYEAAENGKEAVEAVGRRNFDLVLMDLHMPSMNGYEASKAIRDLPLERQPVIIALSASATGDISEKLEQAAINGFVPKPFSPAQLFEKLSQHLGADNGDHIIEEEIPAAPVSTNMSRFEKMSQGNTEFMRKALGSSLQAFINYQKEIQSITSSRNSDALASLIHKMSMSLYYVQAYRLSTLMEQYGDMLQHQAGETERLEQLEHGIDQEFQKVIIEIGTYLESIRE